MVETMVEVDEKQQRLISKLGQSWYESLKLEFEKDYMKELSLKVANARKIKNIFPSSENLFKAYKLTPYDDVKVVILGQDPYHSVIKDTDYKYKPIANGLAFGSENDTHCPPSLDYIFKEIEEDVKFGLYLNGDYGLEYWTEQGVMLLNTILTVEQGVAGSHKDWGWERFTDETIKVLNRHPKKLVFMLWGKEAQKKRGLIDHSFHLVLEASHPAAEAYNKNPDRTAGFLGCKHFSKSNEFLKKYRNFEIQW